MDLVVAVVVAAADMDHDVEHCCKDMDPVAVAVAVVVVGDAHFLVHAPVSLFALVLPRAYVDVDDCHCHHRHFVQIHLKNLIEIDRLRLLLLW